MARFVIYLDRANEYRWRLVARNGEKVAASEGYTSKQSAINSVGNIKALSLHADVVDETTNVLSKLLRR